MRRFCSMMGAEMDVVMPVMKVKRHVSVNYRSQALERGRAVADGRGGAKGAGQAGMIAE